MNKNCALKLVNEISLYYDARSKENIKIRLSHFLLQFTNLKVFNFYCCDYTHILLQFTSLKVSNFSNRRSRIFDLSLVNRNREGRRYTSWSPTQEHS